MYIFCSLTRMWWIDQPHRSRIVKILRFVLMVLPNRPWPLHVERCYSCFSLSVCLWLRWLTTRVMCSGVNVPLRHAVYNKASKHRPRETGKHSRVHDFNIEEQVYPGWSSIAADVLKNKQGILHYTFVAAVLRVKGRLTWCWTLDLIPIPTHEEWVHLRWSWRVSCWVVRSRVWFVLMLGFGLHLVNGVSCLFLSNFESKVGS